MITVAAEHALVTMMLGVIYMVTLKNCKLDKPKTLCWILSEMFMAAPADVTTRLHED